VVVGDDELDQNGGKGVLAMLCVAGWVMEMMRMQDG